LLTIPRFFAISDAKVESTFAEIAQGRLTALRGRTADDASSALLRAPDIATHID
jgi:hypothetical protein